jgi:hypothetical protein
MARAAMPARGSARRAARPVLQMNEGEAGTLAVTAEAEAGDGEHAVDEICFSSLSLEVVADLVSTFPGAAAGRARRRIHLRRRENPGLHRAGTTSARARIEEPLAATMTT